MHHYLSRVKTLIGFAAPITGTQIINILPPIFATLFVAQLGKHELAAAALATSTFITFIATGASFFNALSVLISHRKEKKAFSDVGLIFRHGLVFALIFGLILGMLLWHMDKILLLFGQDPHLVSLTRSYFHFAGFSIVLMLLLSSIEQYFIGIGKARVSLIISACVAPLSIILSYGLILGHFGLPKMALSGIMAASLIVQSLALVIVLLILFRSDDAKRYALFSINNILALPIAKNILSLGFPNCIQIGTELIAITIITYFMGWFGADALATAQIVNQYIVLLVMVYLGFSSAVSIVTSRAYANHDYLLVKEYSHVAILLMSVYFILIGIIFIFFPTPLIDLFLDTAHIHHGQIEALGRAFFLISIFTNYADSIRYVLAGAYRGLQDSKTPMYVGMFCLWVIGISTSYILGIGLHIGPIGVRLGPCMGIICAAIFLLYNFYQYKLPSLKGTFHAEAP